MARITRHWLSFYHRNEAANWDIPIYKLMSIVLIVALNSRSGDVSLSSRYIGNEYLHWKDVHIQVPPDSTDLKEIEIRVVLRYSKAKKDVLQDDIIKHFTLIQNVNYLHVCPIVWILIHALRQDLVKDGPRLEGVLEHARKYNGCIIEWTEPDYPVLAAISLGSGLRQCDPASPASSYQPSIR
ncbi:hypothetical protein FQN54_000132 [Arachnomyces sp. PD_36]|nr:hypothetical protein FQN54_000132 [Arachnomyces sp. PD_36]